MQFRGTCIALEDSSYDSKRSGRVKQMTLTCLDADTALRLKDTIDVVLPQEEFEQIKERPIDKTFEFQVIEIRAGRGPRFRFDARLAATK
jgi:hypothetical protein